jgi:hypothetical protein
MRREESMINGQMQVLKLRESPQKFRMDFSGTRDGRAGQLPA